MKIRRNRVKANNRKAQLPGEHESKWIEKLKNKTYDDYQKSSDADQQMMLKLGTKPDTFTAKFFDAPNFWRLYFHLRNETESNFLNEAPRYVTPDTTTILGLLTLGKQIRSTR